MKSLFTITLLILSTLLIAQDNQSELAAQWENGSYERFGGSKEGKEVQISFEKNTDGKVVLVKIGSESFEPDAAGTEHVRYYKTTDEYNSPNHLYFTKGAIVLFSHSNNETYIKFFGSYGKAVKESKIKPKIKSDIAAGKPLQKDDLIKAAQIAKENSIVGRNIQSIDIELIYEGSSLAQGATFMVGFTATMENGQIIKSASLGGPQESEGIIIEVTGAEDTYESDPKTKYALFEVQQCIELEDKAVTAYIFDSETYEELSSQSFPIDCDSGTEKNELVNLWKDYPVIRYVSESSREGLYNSDWNAYKSDGMYSIQASVLKEDGIEYFKEDVEEVMEKSVSRYAVVSNTYSSEKGIVEIATGKLMFPMEYEDALPIDYNGAVALKKDGKWKFVDASTQKEIPGHTYDNIEMLYNGFSRLTKDELYGFCDQNMKIVVPIKYTSSLRLFRHGYFAVGIDGKCGYLGKNGDVAIPLEYDNSSYFGKTLAPVKLNGGWGFINAANELIVGCEYILTEDYIEYWGRFDIASKSNPERTGSVYDNGNLHWHKKDSDNESSYSSNDSDNGNELSSSEATEYTITNNTGKKLTVVLSSSGFYRTLEPGKSEVVPCRDNVMSTYVTDQGTTKASNTVLVEGKPSCGKTISID